MLRHALTMRSRFAVAALCAVAAVPAQAAVSRAATVSFPTGDRIDLRVLVLTDGSAPVEAIRTELGTEGVPYTSIDLGSTSRQQLTADFLAGTAGGVPEAHFDAVVLPNNAPAQLSAAEISALDTYEATYSIRVTGQLVWSVR